jgi:hypothetical protein
MSLTAPDDATIDALAKRTRTAHDVVREIYAEEAAAVHSEAKVKNFVSVIAGRRTKQRLLALQVVPHPREPHE